MLKEATQVGIQLKDIEILTQIKSKCQNKEVLTLIEQAMNELKKGK